MSNHNLKQIMARLNDHEKRINKLEKNKMGTYPKIPLGKQKQITLAEMIRGRNFNSGQEKITVIIGYYEKIIQKSPIKEAEIKTGWIKGKFDGKYRSILLERVVKDGLVRDLENKNFDLSQTGERFFDNFLKPNAGNNQKGAEKQNKR